MKDKIKNCLEVYEEDDNAEVNEGVRSRDEVSLLLQNEDQRSNDGSLGVAGLQSDYEFTSSCGAVKGLSYKVG